MKQSIRVFAIFVVILIVLIPVNVRTLHTSEKLVQNEIASHIVAYQKEMSDTFKRVRQLAYSLCYSLNVVSSSLRDDEMLKASGRIYDFYKSTLLFQHTDVWNNDFVIVFKKNNLILSNTGAGYNGRFTYENGSYRYVDMTYDEYRNRIFSSDESFWPAAQITNANGSVRKVITYNQYYQFKQETTIAFSSIFDVEELIEHFIEQGDIVEKASVSIFDRNHNLLYATDGAFSTFLNLEDEMKLSVNEETYRIWTMPIANDDMIFQVYMPEYVFDNYLIPVTSFVRNTMMIALLVALVSAVLYAWYLYMPIKPLYTLLERMSIPLDVGHSGIRDIFSQLRITLEKESEIYAQITDSNRRLNDTITVSALRHAVLGSTLTVDEHRILSEKKVFSDGNGAFRILVFAQNDLTYDALKEFQLFCMMDFGEDWSECLLCQPNELVLPVPAHCKEMLNENSMIVKYAHQCIPQAKIGWSSPCTGIENLEYAYMQAIKDQYGETQSADLQKKRIEAYVPTETYLLLTAAIRRGDAQRLTNIMNDLSEWLFKMCTTKTWAMVTLFNIRQAIALASEKSEVSSLNSVKISADIEQELTGLRRWAMQLCSKNAPESDDVADKIGNYVKTNFSNPDLSLTMLSNIFSLSENYISVLIKRQTGLTYAQYITKLRMDEAMRLLTQTTRSIDQIVEDIGYTSKNTMYKAFKKTWMNPPNHFRK